MIYTGDVYIFTNIVVDHIVGFLFVFIWLLQLNALSEQGWHFIAKLTNNHLSEHFGEWNLKSTVLNDTLMLLYCVVTARHYVKLMESFSVLYVNSMLLFIHFYRKGRLILHGYLLLPVHSLNLLFAKLEGAGIQYVARLFLYSMSCIQFRLCLQSMHLLGTVSFLWQPKHKYL